MTCVQVCKVCYDEDCPVIPYGTGTGLEAGISAIYGGVCIDLSKMDQIHDYNPEDFDVQASMPCFIAPTTPFNSLN